MISWEVTENYMCGKSKNFVFTEKIASFDLDWTLIKTKSGKTFPRSKNDWMFFSDNVVNVLNQLEKKGLCIIIISNQLGLKTNNQRCEWMEKINDISNKLNTNLMIFCSCGSNYKYRKPRPTFFFDFFPHKIFSKCDFENSFYCGDACGRKKDHSDVDIKFAKNCKLKFVTPEMLFTNKKTDSPKITYPVIDFNNNNEIEFTPNYPEMIIMIGYIASGKSTIATILNKKYNYEIINQDKLKTKSKCMKLASELMAKNKSIIIDATNINKSSRKEWIDRAKQYNYNTRAILMDTSFEISKHNCFYRSLELEIHIPMIALNVCKSKYEKPSLYEGFQEIIKMKSRTCMKPNSMSYMYFMYLY